jgi:pimeloyl-ACP methyl ester carboxylesterase
MFLWPWRKHLTGMSLLLLCMSPAWSRDELGDPVKRLGNQILTVATEQGKGELPIEVSANFAEPHPEITRAIIVIHGKHRNVEDYFAAIEKAARHADARKTTLIIAPQFLNDVDIPAHHLSDAFLRWKRGQWSAGEPSDGSVPINSFAIVDQLLLQLSDKSRFPALKEVVLAGHSGGGQFVQRYAIIGHAPEQLAQANLELRFVVANPSTYFYFNDERPTADGSLAPFAGAVSCKSFDHWRYGPTHAPTAYIGASSFTDLERSYFARNVVVLLGTADTDPNHPDLDTSCAAEAQGPNRLERGKAYFRYERLQHADPHPHLFWLVPGVGHDDTSMFNSTCGIAALFDVGSCATPLR